MPVLSRPALIFFILQLTRWGLATPALSVYQPSPQEAEALRAVKGMDGQITPSALLHRYQDLLEMFPASPRVPAEILFVLLRADQVGDASTVLKSAIRRFPGDLELNYLANEVVPRLEAEKDREGRRLFLLQAKESLDKLHRSILLGAKSLNEVKMAGQVMEVKELVEGCFVWQQETCNAQTRRADEEFVREVTKGGGTRATIARAVSGRGLTYLFKRGDPKTAVFRFNQALLLDPKLAEAWWGAGTAFAMLGMVQPAEKLLKKAIQVDPKQPEPYNNLGLLYSRYKGDMKGAEKFYRTAIQIAPGYAETYYNLSVLFFQRGKFADSQAWLKQAKVKGARVQPEFERDLASKMASIQ